MRALARALTLLAALAPTLALADADCSRSEGYDALLRQVQLRRQSYGWLAELANSCWKAPGKPVREHCFEFGRRDGVLLISQRVDHRTTRTTPVPPAEFAIQPSGDITLIAGGSLRRLAPRRFALVFQPEGGPMTRLVFTRTPEIFGACKHGER